MKHFPLISLIGIAAIAGIATALQPASAAEVDVRPPEIGLISASQFTVNHLTDIQATVSSQAGLTECDLYINDKNNGKMDIRDGRASAQRVFSTPETRYVSIRCSDGIGNIGIGPTSALLATAEPLGFTEGMLVQPTCLPGDWHGDYCNAVYVIQNGQRHAFTSKIAQTSWYPESTRIISVSPAALATLALGPMISAKPGTVVIRFLSQSQLYQVIGDKNLLRVSSEKATGNVDVLTDAFYTQFIIEPAKQETGGMRA